MTNDACSHFTPLLVTAIGLREKYDIFPQEIYYSLSEAKIQEYKTRWSEKGGLWSPSTEGLRAKEPRKREVEEVDNLKRDSEKLNGEREKINREIEQLQGRTTTLILMKLLERCDQIDTLESQLNRIEKLLQIKP